MKKIALVAFSLNPQWGSEAGMANRWLQIVNKQYAVDVYTPRINEENIRASSYPNTRFVYVDGLEKLRWLGHATGLVNITTSAFFKKTHRLLKTSKPNRYEFIHCITPAGIHSHNSLYTLGRPILIGPLGGGLPSPAGFDSAFRQEKFRTLLRDAFYRLKLRRSRKLKEYFTHADRIALGLSVPIELIPNEARPRTMRIPDALVDTNYFTPRELTQHDSKTVRILFAGRLVSNKGASILLDSIQGCLDNGLQSFHVEIAGDGPLRKPIEQIIQSKGLQHVVTLSGSLSKPEMREAYLRSDIFCLPTLREPGGIAILEAMACGLPVITSNYGGPAVSVNSDCGILIEMTGYQSYVDQLTSAITALVRNSELRERLGSAGRCRAVHSFSTEAFEQNIENFYALD